MYAHMYAYALLDMLSLAYRDWYQPGALLACEDGVIIAGMLVGLNTIDYNVVMKGEDFDKPVRLM